MVVMAPVETVCTGGTLKPFWPIPPGEITGRSAGGGGGCTTGSWIVAVKVALKVPAVAVMVRVPALVPVAEIPACPLPSVEVVPAERVAEPAVTANATGTPAAGSPVLPVSFTMKALSAVPVVPV